MLEYAENVIFNEYSEIMLAASLPAKGMYQKRGYKDAVFHMIQVNYNDFLCYDVMIRQI